MRRLSLLLFVALVFAACKKEDTSDSVTKEFGFYQPAHFPEVEYDLAKNPVTTEGFLLGKKLFMDGNLSRDGSISCAHCHLTNSAFTQHGHDLAHGIDNRKTVRNALPVQNLAWQKDFAWDGGVQHLDLFAVAPITNPMEMDESLPNVLDKIKADTNYQALFKDAFDVDTIGTEHFLKALAQFQLMCISDNSPFDKHMKGEQFLDGDALEGMLLFETKCATCHSGVLQSDQSYRNNGLSIGNPNDRGRANVTGLEEDAFKFRVPSLRNLSYTFPYMHDGRFQTIDEVLNHYDSGVEQSETLDPLLLNEDGSYGIFLSTDEKAKLKAFLKSLDDESFVSNPIIEVF